MAPGPLPTQKKAVLFSAENSGGRVRSMGFLKSDYSDEGRDFPTGPEKAWSWTISYLRLKHLAQIRSRGPEKRPKTVPTTTFSTATSEKTTQNFGLITRQFTKSQAIIAQDALQQLP